MLIDEYWVAIGVHCDKTGRPRASLVGFGQELYALRFQLALEIANVGERIEFACVAVPTWIEG